MPPVSHFRFSKAITESMSRLAHDALLFRIFHSLFVVVLLCGSYDPIYFQRFATLEYSRSLSGS